MYYELKGEGPDADLHAKMDTLLEKQEQSIRLRQIGLVATGAGLVIGMARLGQILQDMRERRRAAK